ncbi:MAG TPA: polynucleotide adenylyltransferase PcnB [Myxococcales bacterium]|nr:polynucleotide adenylyltransferase PcnB [Myxococcales bacterium]
MIPASPLQQAPVSLPRQLIDSDALSVCRRLQGGGFIAYLVGGCVRDIILGRTPKDFDVATSATPNEVRGLFRNCRIIGRRFRLAHIHFGSKIIEVATFRGGDVNEDDADAVAEEGDRLIIRANNFGTPEQDAESRDFTINGLFYDPIEQKLIDNVNGYVDVSAHMIRTIGDPDIRFQEDPVRILRGIKFAARLGFELHPDTLAAMGNVGDDISRCPIPRVTEEMYRLTESNHTSAVMRLLHETGIMSIIFPKISEYLENHSSEYFRYLEVVDQMATAHGGVPRTLVMSLLFYPIALQRVLDAGVAPGPSWGKYTQEWFNPIGMRMHVAVKHRIRLGAIMSLMGRFMAPQGQRRRHRMATAERYALPQALTLLRLKHRLEGGCEEIYQTWRELARDEDISWVPTAEEPRQQKTRTRRKRRR